MAAEPPHTERSPLLGPRGNGNASYSSTAEVNNQPDASRAEAGTDANKQESPEGLNLRYILPAVAIGVRIKLPVLSQ